MSDVVGQSLLEVSADGSGFDAAIGRMTRTAKEFETTAVESAGRGGDAYTGMGAKADRGAQAVDRATANLRASIERATAAAIAGERGTSKFFEQIAQQRGANMDVLKPYIAGLRAAEEAQKATASSIARQATSLNLVGVSAGQTAAALRQLPAQFTDIFTSLQGGQNVVTVLLQQGGQIKDSFGGVGNAFRAVAAAVNPLTLALGGAALVVGAVGVAYAQGAKETDEFRKALVLSGNVIGATTGQLDAAAASVSALVGTQGRAAEIIAQLAGSASVARSDLAGLTEAALRLQRAGGPAAEETAKAFADLGKDPAQSVLKLNEATHFLTTATFDQVKALSAQGRTADAASVAQNAYAVAVKSRAKELEDGLGSLQRGWRAVGEAASQAWDRMVGTGRAETVEGRVAAITEELERRRQAGGGAQSSGPVLRGLSGSRANRPTPQLQQEQSVGQSDLIANRRAAELKAQARAASDAGLKLRELADAFKPPGQALEEQIAKIKELGRTAKDGGVDIDALIAKTRAGSEANAIAVATAQAKIATQASLAAIATESLIARIQHGVAVQSLASQNASASLRLEVEALEAVAEAQQAATRAEEERISASIKLTPKLPGNAPAIAALEGEIEVVRARRGQIVEKLDQDIRLLRERQITEIRNGLRDLSDDGAKAFEDLAQRASADTAATQRAVEAYRNSIDESIESQRLELSLIGATNAQRAIALEQFRIEIGRRREIERINATNFAGDVDEAARTRQELIDKANAAADRAKANAATSVLEKAYADAGQRIADLLTDDILAGGRTAAASLRDIFKQLVLRPIVRAIIEPIANDLASASGSGVVNTGLNLLSQLGNFASAAGRLLGSEAITQFAAGIKGLNLAPGLAGPTTAGATGATGAGAAFVQTAGQTLFAFQIGRSIGQSISSGFSAAGNSGNTAVNVGAAIGTIWGPIGTVIGAAIGGLVNRVFGTKVTDTGIKGTFGGATGFTGERFTDIKGGLFRSDRTKTDPLDAQIERAIGLSAQSLRTSLGNYAQTLGLPVDAINAFSKEVKISLKDLDPNASKQEIEARISQELNKAFDAFTLDLADLLDGALAPFERAGETTRDTLQRLAQSISSVNPILDKLGVAQLAVSTAGGDAASQLADLFGGTQTLLSTAADYYDRYFTAGERANDTTAAIAKALADVGLALPNTRDQFRALVEAQDVSTESGRKAFTALLGVASVFDEVQKSADELRSKLGDAIQAALPKFQSPGEQRASQFQRIADDLNASGIAVTVEQLIAATKDQIREVATAIVSLGGVSDEAKIKIVDAAGSLADLKDQAAAAAAEIATKRAGLEIDLLRATGQETEAVARERRAEIEALRLLDPALAQVKQSIYDATDAAAAMAKQRQLDDAVRNAVPSFLSPRQQVDFKFGDISSRLGGLGFNVSPDQLRGFTPQQIVDVTTELLHLSSIAPDTKIALVGIATELLDLGQTARQQRIDDLLKGVAGSFEELEQALNPAQTLLQRFTASQNDLAQAQQNLDRILGRTVETVQQKLERLIGAQRELQGFRSGALTDAIEQARLATLTPQGRIAALRANEGSLFRQLQTADDPVSIAQRLQEVITNRVREEAALTTKYHDDQIDALTRLRDLAKELAQFTPSLRFSDLSPLSFKSQLGEAQALFDRTLAGAQAGDPTAQGNLTSNARALLEEAQAYFASGPGYAQIFANVTKALDSIGAAGANVDPQIAAIQSVRDSLESGALYQELSTLNTAVLAREASNAGVIQEQLKLATDQVERLSRIIEVLEAQIVQKRDEILGNRAAEVRLVGAIEEVSDALQDAALGG